VDNATSKISIAARLNRLPIIPTHRRVTFIIGVGLFFEFYEFFLISILASTLAKQFHIPPGSSLLPLLLASTSIGMLFGAIGFNYFADRAGRRTAFMLNLGIYSLFSLIGAASPNILFLLITRFIAGLGVGAELPLCDSYLSDILPSRARGPYIAWAYTVSFLGLPALGFLASLLVPHYLLGLAGWRWLFIVGALGSAIVWLLRRGLPESPRWLEAVGRVQEADAIVERMEQEAKEVTHSDQLPKPHADELPSQATTPFRAMFQSVYRGRLIMLSVFHFFEPFSINGFGLLVPLILTAKGLTITTSLVYSAISYVGYPLGSILTSFIAERIERKWLLAISGLLMVIFGIAFGFSSASALILAFGFGFAICSTIFSDGWHIYQGELFPTHARATASGLAYSLSRVSTALLPFILVPILYHYGAVAVFVVIGIATLIALADVVIFGPLTTGRPLEYVNPPAPSTALTLDDQTVDLPEEGQHSASEFVQAVSPLSHTSMSSHAENDGNPSQSVEPLPADSADVREKQTTENQE
jgi:putative MFS transporter